MDAAAPASRSEGARPDRHDRLTELIAALILSCAALLSSYAGFQAQRWDGQRAAFYAMAEQSRTAASREAMIAAEMRTLDMLLFSQWLNAYAARNEELQRFYRGRFRPSFERAFGAWVQTRPMRNPDAPLSPLEMGIYARTADRLTRQFERQADRYFARGGRANEVSDGFFQITAILALSLFVGGVVQAFKTHRLRVTLLGVAAFSLLLALVRILALPGLRLTL